jgi:hypothetical protein
MREKAISAVIVTGSSSVIISVVALVIPIVEKPIAMVGLIILGGIGILAVAQRLSGPKQPGAVQGGGPPSGPAN